LTSASIKPRLSLEEWRKKRQDKRDKQRLDNIGRAAKMHALRLMGEVPVYNSPLGNSTGTQYFVGCSGWFYWKWRGTFYPADLPTSEWFTYYARRFDTVEINASFYSWPTQAGVKAWLRAAGRKQFVYTVKVCELITHVKKFVGTKTLVCDFGVIADLLQDRMGCFLYQLPPSYHYSPARLKSILAQLDHSRRNVVEFRHASWWREKVFDAFRKTGTMFCSVSAPRLPDELVKTADDIYIRLHGKERWYRHDYTKAELTEWKDRIEASGAKHAWIYFDNDFGGYAPKNARTLRKLLARKRSSPFRIRMGRCT
jgi:uncharacterized protein YecE (DUF72 family)